ncbi:glycosyltransferase family 4 protein [Halomonas sp. WWR20]
MKILIDLDSLTPPVTGIGHYTRQIGKYLLRHDDVESLTALMYTNELTSSQIRGLLETDMQKDIDMGKSSSVPGYQLAQRLLPLLRNAPAARAVVNRWKSYRYSKITEKLQNHVYWEPNFVLKPFSGPSALTIHDISFLVHPELHPPTRLSYITTRLGPSIERASHIIVVSRFTFDAVRTELGVPASQMSIVSPAADKEFQPISAEEARHVRQRFSLPEKYILSVGTLEPRKNLSRLLKAYEGLPDKLRHEWPLVCIGGKGWNDTNLNADIAYLERRGELIRLGYVDQADLPKIVAAAGLMAYVSVYEGFGMPVAEAMACGVPVMTSRDSAMEEIAGERAFYVDPFDIDNIRDTLREALENEPRRNELAALGPSQARRYSWEQSADTLVSILKPLAE